MAPRNTEQDDSADIEVPASDAAEKRESQRPDYAGMVLMCEEYHQNGEDFCHWVERPHQLPTPAILFDAEFATPVGEIHRWRPEHAVLVVVALVYVWWSLRRVSRIRRAGDKATLRKKGDVEKRVLNRVDSGYAA